MVTDRQRRKLVISQQEQVESAKSNKVEGSTFDTIKLTCHASRTSQYADRNQWTIKGRGRNSDWELTKLDSKIKRGHRESPEKLRGRREGQADGEDLWMFGRYIQLETVKTQLNR